MTANRLLHGKPWFPDPSPGELAAHVAEFHGVSFEDNIVALAQAHMLAHVRGVFIKGIHFHKENGA